MTEKITSQLPPWDGVPRVEAWLDGRGGARPLPGRMPPPPPGVDCSRVDWAVRKGKCLPDEMAMTYRMGGFTFEFVVRGVPEGFARLFPDLAIDDEFLRSVDLPTEVARVVASVLDSAVGQFLPAFEAASARLVAEGLDAVPGTRKRAGV